MNLNINADVKVKLTNYGRNILLEDYKKSCIDIKYFPPIEDDEGWSTWQLWRLMQIFGKHMRLGVGEAPFETEIIICIK